MLKKMGLSHLELNTLLFLRKRHELGKVLTLGRQCLLLNYRFIEKTLNSYHIHYDKNKLREICQDVYIDRFLIEILGAESVDSVDASNYEGANIVQDLGQKDTCLERKAKWDTILDFGTMEHVFNISTVFENCVYYANYKSYILHVNPGNGYSGHGCYQISPEAYLSFYGTPANSNKSTCRVFFGNDMWPDKWFELTPRLGRRIELSNYNHGLMYTICFAQLNLQSSPKARDIYQESYKHLWKNKSNEKLFSHNLFNKLAIRLYVIIFYILNKFLPFLKPPAGFHPSLKRFSPKDEIS